MFWCEKIMFEENSREKEVLESRYRYLPVSLTRCPHILNEMPAIGLPLITGICFICLVFAYCKYFPKNASSLSKGIASLLPPS